MVDLEKEARGFVFVVLGLDQDDDEFESYVLMTTKWLEGHHVRNQEKQHKQQEQ